MLINTKNLSNQFPKCIKYENKKQRYYYVS